MRTASPLQKHRFDAEKDSGDGGDDRSGGVRLGSGIELDHGRSGSGALGGSSTGLADVAGLVGAVRLDDDEGGERSDKLVLEGEVEGAGDVVADDNVLVADLLHDILHADGVFLLGAGVVFALVVLFFVTCG